jgi:type IV pilus assembly protein PilC
MIFQYKALKNGKVVIDKIEAKDIKSVSLYLQAKEIFPIWIKPLKEERTMSLLDRVGFNDVVDFTRQIAIMVNAGLTLTEALDILKKQVKKPSLHKLIENLSNEIKAGNSFSSALKKYSNYFSDLYISLIRSAEVSGKLGEIMLKLSDNLEKEREFKGKIKGAMIYPVIILTGMFSVMFIMITFVIPKLLNLYKEFNVELPFTTQILIMVSSFFVKFWPLLILAIVGSVLAFRKYLSTSVGKYTFDSFLLKLPVINNVIKISALVNTTRTLAILLGSGISILEALDIVVDATDNAIYQKSFKNVKKKVERGQSLGSAMDEEGIFPPILVQMAQVGEQTGRLDDTLLRLSHFFEIESELAVKAMTTLIEPAILVILGLGVGFLVMSVITPIYNLTSSFK